nr:MAG TPA: hypothetical protein [Caudoviricetes sp.]
MDLRLVFLIGNINIFLEKCGKRGVINDNIT